MPSNKDHKNLSKAIRKLKFPIPVEIFNALNATIPISACEIVIFDKSKGLLLTWREDEFWKGWHFPGSIIRKGEKFEQTLKRVAKDELGRNLKSHQFIFPMNYHNGPRGHSVSFVFLCELSGQPKDGKFFKTMPKDIIKDHRELWKNFQTFQKNR